MNELAIQRNLKKCHRINSILMKKSWNRVKRGSLRWPKPRPALRRRHQRQRWACASWTRVGRAVTTESGGWGPTTRTRLLMGRPRRPSSIRWSTAAASWSSLAAFRSSTWARPPPIRQFTEPPMSSPTPYTLSKRLDLLFNKWLYSDLWRFE